MEGFLPILFLMVVLKIPVGLLLYIVWWAFRAETQPDQAPPESGDHRFRRFRREPKRPRGPRRGGHGPDAVPVPELAPGLVVSSAPGRDRRSGPRRPRSRTRA